MTKRKPSRSRESNGGNGRREGSILLSLSPAERALVTASARWCGELRVSSWCRDALLNHAREILNRARTDVLATKKGTPNAAS